MSVQPPTGQGNARSDSQAYPPDQGRPYCAATGPPTRLGARGSPTFRAVLLQNRLSNLPAAAKHDCYRPSGRFPNCSDSRRPRRPGTRGCRTRPTRPPWPCIRQTGWPQVGPGPGVPELGRVGRGVRQVQLEPVDDQQPQAPQEPSHAPCPARSAPRAGRHPRPPARRAARTTRETPHGPAVSGPG